MKPTMPIAVLAVAACVTGWAWAATQPVFSAPAERKPLGAAEQPTGIVPRSVQFGLPDTPVDVRLARLDATQLRAEDDLRRAEEKAFRIGVVRTLPGAASSSPRKNGAGRWTTLADGGRLWRLTIEAPDAVGVRLHLRRTALPEDGDIVAYATLRPWHARGPYTAASFRGRDARWTETVFSERVTLECYSPPTAGPPDIDVSVDRIVHLYRSPFALAKEGPCHNDVTCYAAWQDTSSAISGIQIVQGLSAVWCTGCLLNDQDPTGPRNYYMTANHCVSNQNQADSTEYYWFFQTAACNGSPPVLGDVPLTGGGADYLAGKSRLLGNDFAFLQLRTPPPGGVTYAGWTTAAPGASETLSGIHHPDGAFKRISFGTVIRSNPNYWFVRWSAGVTEPGSSGSPLFNAQQQFIGQLFGGFSSCQNPDARDEYGRFDVSFPVIQPWLAGAPCEDWQCLYSVMFEDPAQIQLFRRFRDRVLREDPVGEAATRYLYRQSESALAVLAGNPAVAGKASALAMENRDALGMALSGDTGVIRDTVAVLAFLWEVEQHAGEELAVLARASRAILAWKLLTGEEFLGLRFEQWPWIQRTR